MKQTATTKRKKSSPTRQPIPLSVRMAVFERDNYTCRICGKSRKMGARLEVDHIQPVSKKGTNQLANLQTLCFECNRGKSNRLYPNLTSSVQPYHGIYPNPYRVSRRPIALGNFAGSAVKFGAITLGLGLLITLFIVLIVPLIK